MLSIKKVILFGALLGSSFVNAGNEDRVGTAGATHLLINPWSRGSSMGDAGIASSTGLEASFTNIAGLAFVEKTQIKFNSSNWMGNAGISFSSAGLAQRISEGSAFSVSIQAMNFGDIAVTTVANPEGKIGYFSPRINVFNVGYAKSFSSSIHAGINFKVISESMTNMKSTGIGMDVHVERFEKDHDDYNAIMIKALSDRLAEAFAELMHEKVRTSIWAYASCENLSKPDLIKESYQGIRPAPGYPACPDHTEKNGLFKLLDATRITGVSLTESLAMLPTSSVSGWYFAHPQAKYFGLGKITNEQVESISARKKIPFELMERWLGSVIH